MRDAYDALCECRKWPHGAASLGAELCRRGLLPPKTISATLHMEGGEPPLLTIVRFAEQGWNEVAKLVEEQFVLVPKSSRPAGDAGKTVSLQTGQTTFHRVERSRDRRP